MTVTGPPDRPAACADRRRDAVRRPAVLEPVDLAGRHPHRLPGAPPRATQRLGPRHRPDPRRRRPVTHDTRRGITTYHWTDDPRWLLYLQDTDGNEDWHLYRVDLDAPDAPAVDLTPMDPGHACSPSSRDRRCPAPCSSG